jgi:DnaK suppressor protein
VREDIVDGRIARRRRAADIMAMTATRALITKSRDEELKTMLEELRRELMLEVHAKIRDARTENGHPGNGFDEGEAADVDIQEEIEFTLIQMKTETLNKINTALRRIDEGTYGVCFECGDEIAGPRLRALPFALRCKDCEDTREMAERRERIAARGSSPSLFSELST